MVNTVVVWLRTSILGPYWCMYGALFGSRPKHVGAVLM